MNILKASSFNILSPFLRAFLLFIIAGYCSFLFAATIQSSGDSISEIKINLSETKKYDRSESILPYENNVLNGIENNQKIIKLCESCHGESITSSNQFLPILYGQNYEYLFKKIKLFAKNQRSLHPFSSSLKGLEDQEIADLSYYFANKKSPLVQSLVNFERNDSIQKCFTCHENNGNGHQIIPKISGQNPGYLAFRIREIFKGSSDIHLQKLQQRNCQVELSNYLVESKQISKKLNLILNKGKLKKGKNHFKRQCLECHQNQEMKSDLAHLLTSFPDSVKLMNQHWAKKIKFPNSISHQQWQLALYYLHNKKWD